MAGRKVARKRGSSFTPETTGTILEGIGKGLHIEPACRAAGVNRSTVWRWLDKAREAAKLEEDGKDVPSELVAYLEFGAAFQEAEADLEQRLVTRVMDEAEAATGDYRATLAVLARRFPERWSEKIAAAAVTAAGSAEMGGSGTLSIKLAFEPPPVMRDSDPNRGEAQLSTPQRSGLTEIVVDAVLEVEPTEIPQIGSPTSDPACLLAEPEPTVEVPAAPSAGRASVTPPAPVRRSAARTGGRTKRWYDGPGGLRDREW